MRMKAAFACMMVVFMATVPVFAQDQPSGDERQPPSAADIVAKMQSVLNLTQDQVTAVTPIIEKYSSKREELRQSMEDGTTDKDSIRSQMKELKESEKQELSQILSEDQVSQWEKMQGQGRHKHKSDGDGGGDSGPGGSDGEG